jgi:hypothetical protein
MSVLSSLCGNEWFIFYIWNASVIGSYIRFWERPGDLPQLKFLVIVNLNKIILFYASSTSDVTQFNLLSRWTLDYPLKILPVVLVEGKAR